MAEAIRSVNKMIFLHYSGKAIQANLQEHDRKIVIFITGWIGVRNSSVGVSSMLIITAETAFFNFVMDEFI